MISWHLDNGRFEFLTYTVRGWHLQNAKARVTDHMLHRKTAVCEILISIYHLVFG
jgi:hypothetical protein